MPGRSIVIIRLKGGPGSGWFAPGKGTHTGEKHRQVGSGKAVAGKKIGRMLGGIAEDAELRKYHDGYAHLRKGLGPSELSMAKGILGFSGLDLEEDAVRKEIYEWGQGPTDGVTQSALIMAAAAAFELDVPRYQRDAYQRHIDSGYIKGYLGSASGSDLSHANKAAFLKAMYSYTQADIKSKMPGVDVVRLYRGTAADSVKGAGIGDGVRMTLAPLSSWTVDVKGAQKYASWYGGKVVAVNVGVDKILSMSTTGIGDFWEDEVVLIGGTYVADVVGEA